MPNTLATLISGEDSAATNATKLLRESGSNQVSRGIEGFGTVLQGINDVQNENLTRVRQNTTDQFGADLLAADGPGDRAKILEDAAALGSNHVNLGQLSGMLRNAQQGAESRSKAEDRKRTAVNREDKALIRATLDNIGFMGQEGLDSAVDVRAAAKKLIGADDRFKGTDKDVKDAAINNTVDLWKEATDITGTSAATFEATKDAERAAEFQREERKLTDDFNFKANKAAGGGTAEIFGLKDQRLDDTEELAAKENLRKEFEEIGMNDASVAEAESAITTQLGYAPNAAELNYILRDSLSANFGFGANSEFEIDSLINNSVTAAVKRYKKTVGSDEAKGLVTLKRNNEAALKALQATQAASSKKDRREAATTQLTKAFGS